MSLADNLKRIRKEKHISQEELAEELNVSRQAISKWAQGICLPEAKMLLLISEKLDVSLDGLMSDSPAVSDEADPVSNQIKDDGVHRQSKKRRTVYFLLGALFIVALCLAPVLYNLQKETDNDDFDHIVVVSPNVESELDGETVVNEAVETSQRGDTIFTTPEDRDRIFELSCEFAEAYFAQDFDSIRLFLSTDFVGNPKDTCPWTGIDTYTVQGVDSISTEKANGTKVISIEFRNPDYPDSFVYLTIEFVKLDGEWKIHAYYLQP